MYIQNVCYFVKISQCADNVFQKFCKPKSVDPTL